MSALLKEAEAKPADKTALHKLENYTTDPDFWNRFYACGSLGELASKNVGGCRDELLPYFDTALNDPQEDVRQEAVEAIADIGSPAVERSLPKLLNIIRAGQEDSITWFALNAVGELKNKQMVPDALPVLLQAARKQPPEGTPDAAPQVRYYAVKAIAKIGAANNVNVVPELEKILREDNSPWQVHTANIILKLDSQNKLALEVIAKYPKKP